MDYGAWNIRGPGYLVKKTEVRPLIAQGKLSFLLFLIQGQKDQSLQLL